MLNICAHVFNKCCNYIDFFLKSEHKCAKLLNRVFFTVIICIGVMPVASFDLLHVMMTTVTFITCYYASAGIPKCFIRRSY